MGHVNRQVKAAVMGGVWVPTREKMQTLEQVRQCVYLLLLLSHFDTEVGAKILSGRNPKKNLC